MKAMTGLLRRLLPSLKLRQASQLLAMTLMGVCLISACGLKRNLELPGSNKHKSQEDSGQPNQNNSGAGDILLSPAPTPSPTPSPTPRPMPTPVPSNPDGN
jgi:predicted small lipoprotein YifL